MHHENKSDTLELDFEEDFAHGEEYSARKQDK
jgi:hypothetical protein